tara:strand:+ start:3680 stop:4612 length:933 start_codon:yes stop_codon:yes gene_type:complete
MNNIDITGESFAALILTHGRPDNVLTYDTLRKQGYTGQIVIVIDNEDKSADEYKAKFEGLPGVTIYCFDKLAISKTFDTADNQKDRRTIVYARNASFDIARELGFRYFVQLDDDYFQFIWRFTDKYEFARASHWEGQETSGFYTDNLNRVFTAFIDFLIETPQVCTIAMAQGGDFIGGQAGRYGSTITLNRKAMNSFFCDVNRPIGFIGRINEDVNVYTSKATTGAVFFTHNQIALNQVQTQQSGGGMTNVYHASGTYVKSFYTVMMHPSGARVRMMQSRSNPRLHHSVKWNSTTPMILSEKHRKRSAGA